MSTFSCNFCKKSFKTNSNLFNHQRTAQYCLKIQNKQNNDWICSNCDKVFSTKRTLNSHIEICKKKEEKEESKLEQLRVFYEKEIDQIRKSYEKKLEDMQMKISQKEIEVLNRFITSFQSLAERAIDKPTNVSNSTTNVKGNQNIQNILTDYKIYREQTNPERIKEFDSNLLETYFMKGQRGIAQFCVEHIITHGENKIMVCTDPTRKRFKYQDENGEIKEDIDARIFIKIVSEPIKEVCGKVFDEILEKIEQKIKIEKDAFETNFLEKKKYLVGESYIEIKDFDNEKRNGEYRNELAILLNE